MIRIGLIGAGPRGVGNMKKLLAHEGRCVCSGIADPMEENAKKAAEELGGVEHIVSDFKDLFEHILMVISEIHKNKDIMYAIVSVCGDESISNENCSSAIDSASSFSLFITQTDIVCISST